MDKPPIGIEPQWSFLEKRAHALLAALKRYADTGDIFNTAASVEWAHELADVLERMHKIRGVKDG